MDSLLAYLIAKPDVANAVATISSTIVALAALVVSVVSLVIGIQALKHQRRHNILSVKPVPMVSTDDHEDCLSIALKNNGSGPLIIRSIRVVGGHEPKTYLRACMPSLPNGLAWSTYVGPVKSQSLCPGEAIALLELKGDEADQVFIKFRDQCRVALGPLTVIVDYSDIYGSEIDSHQQPLAWYMRPH